MSVQAGGMVIRISELGEFADRLDRLKVSLPRIMSDSIAEALTNGQSEILADIWKRTPASDRYRYAYRYKAIESGDWKADGTALKSGWRKQIRDANGQRALDRLDGYGMQNLRKAVFGGQDTYGIKGLVVKTGNGRASFTIQVRTDEAPYARRIHEATDITTYWASSKNAVGDKRGRGWSTQGTGAKFLTDPVNNKRALIRADVRAALYSRLLEVMN